MAENSALIKNRIINFLQKWESREPEIVENLVEILSLPSVVDADAVEWRKVLNEAGSIVAAKNANFAVSMKKLLSESNPGLAEAVTEDDIESKDLLFDEKDNEEESLESEDLVVSEQTLDELKSVADGMIQEANELWNMLYESYTHTPAERNGTFGWAFNVKMVPIVTEDALKKHGIENWPEKTIFEEYLTPFVEERRVILENDLQKHWPGTVSSVNFAGRSNGWIIVEDKKFTKFLEIPTGLASLKNDVEWGYTTTKNSIQENDGESMKYHLESFNEGVKSIKDNLEFLNEKNDMLNSIDKWISGEKETLSVLFEEWLTKKIGVRESVEKDGVVLDENGGVSVIKEGKQRFRVDGRTGDVTGLDVISEHTTSFDLFERAKAQAMRDAKRMANESIERPVFAESREFETLALNYAYGLSQPDLEVVAEYAQMEIDSILEKKADSAREVIYEGFERYLDPKGHKEKLYSLTEEKTFSDGIQNEYAENAPVEHHVEPGDYVDFGAQGKAYVVDDLGRGMLWATKDQTQRFNKDAKGKSFFVGDVVTVIQKGSEAETAGKAL